MKFGDRNIGKASSIKFLGVILDKHISWNNHIKTEENKLAKIIGLLNRASYFLNEHLRPLLQKINALNVYQINLYQHLNFKHQFNNQESPRIFNDLIKPVHKYRTNFSKSNFWLKNENVSLNSNKYSISFGGSKLWNEILHKEEKEFECYSLFQNMRKSKLLMIENETKYF